MCSREPSRTCSVTSVRVRQDLNESVADLQQAISAIKKENMPLDTFPVSGIAGANVYILNLCFQFSADESPLPPEEPMRDSLETTYIDTDSATSATNTSEDYWTKHSLFGEMDTLKGVAVQLEVSTTWGHSELMGLTEVEFFTTQSKKVWLSGTRVKIEGHINTYNIEHILNGKTRTTHDTHMWAATYRGRKKIKFHFLVPIGTKQELSAIKIWNYNKPSCLEAGVRGVKIMVDDVSVWEGEVPKATGTKAFDFAHVIRVHIPDSSPSNESPTKSKPEQLIGQLESCKSDQLIRRVRYNPFKSPTFVTTSEPNTPLKSDTATHYKPHTSPQLSNYLSKQSQQLSNQLANQLSYKTTNQLSNKTANQLSNKTANQLSNKTANQLSYKTANQLSYKTANQLSYKTANQLSHSKATAEAPKLKHSMSQSNLLDILFSPPTNQLLEKSYSESELSKLLSADSPTFLAPRHGRRSQMRLGTAVTGKARPELPDAALTDVTHLYAPKSQHNSTTSRHISSPAISHSKGYPRNTPPLKSSHTEPVISGAKPLPSLEEMFQSLATFQLSHRGRIMELKEDTLDLFLEDRTKVRNTPLKLEPVPEPEFLIPELPQGKFLSLIISSTWGDRHYVGLNGIEAFSSNGAQIEVCDIAADPPDINVLSG